MCGVKLGSNGALKHTNTNQRQRGDPFFGINFVWVRQQYGVFEIGLLCILEQRNLLKHVV